MKKQSYVPDQDLITRFRISASETPDGYGDDSDRVFQAWTKNFRDFVDLPASKDGLRLEESLYAVLRRHHNHLASGVPDKIERRIKVLLDKLEFDDAEKPDLDSFEALVEFLSNNPRLKMPSIFLDDAGKFDASWRPARDRLVSINFQNLNAIMWLLFVPWEEDEEGTSEASGRCSPDDFLEQTKGFGVKDWMEA